MCVDAASSERCDVDGDDEVQWRPAGGNRRAVICQSQKGLMECPKLSNEIEDKSECHSETSQISLHYECYCYYLILLSILLYLIIYIYL
jgi:hypothetical protein